MTQVTARLPNELVSSLDRAAQRLKKSRAEVLRNAVEFYVAEHEDLVIAIDRLRDPLDPVLDWQQVRDEILAED